MNAFKDMGKKVFYVTNNSTLTRPEFRDKCTRLGFKATEDDIISTAWLTARYLTNAGFNKRAYIIGSKAIAKELKKVGIESIGVGPDLVNPAKLKSGIVLEELAPSDRDVGAVIVGFDHHFSLPKIVKACTYLADPECLFIGTNTDQTYPHQGNFVWPGTGAFIAAIETGSQRKANIVGKPESFIIDTVLKGSGFDPKRTVMLGDRCNTDIHFGNSGGMLTILVLSGVTSLKELNEYKAQGQTHLLPTFYTNSIADLMPFLGADK
ncbi:hypothetical protein AAG570_005772 [Ranatra chinensis]|uniref:Phosphoglycolate phosphatase n=1 Tax=Ranatra chinensis TaxID=642074 RepID=A0ABD0XZC2_9HEMI